MESGLISSEKSKKEKTMDDMYDTSRKIADEIKAEHQEQRCYRVTKWVSKKDIPNNDIDGFHYAINEMLIDDEIEITTFNPRAPDSIKINTIFDKNRVDEE